MFIIFNDILLNNISNLEMLYTCILELLHFYSLYITDLINLLLSPSKDHLSAGFAGSVLKFFNKLLHFGRQFVWILWILKQYSTLRSAAVHVIINNFHFVADKHPSDKSYEALCGSLSKISNPAFDKSILQKWLSKIILPSEVKFVCLCEILFNSFG